jgi:hypothetical protein
MSRLVIAVLLLLAARHARTVLSVLAVLVHLAAAVHAHAVPLLELAAAAEVTAVAVLAWLTVRQFTPGPAPARAS